jgi:F-type H+-transporting ATPase subunit b
LRIFSRLRFSFPAAGRFLGLAVLAAGLTMAAQQPPGEGKAAGGHAARSATSNLPAQPGQVKREEAEEQNVYRHTPLVTAISDSIFHDDKTATDPEKVTVRDQHIELTARTFEWINAAIILLCIFIPLAKFLPRVMRKRNTTLNQKLEDARKTTDDAGARLTAVEAQLSRLDEEIAKIRAQVEDESKQDEARIKASIEEERARIVASAEQEISAAAAHARRSLRTFAADIAIDQAMKQLVLTPETDRALIAEFINEAQNESGNGAAKGGKK